MAYRKKAASRRYQSKGKRSYSKTTARSTRRKRAASPRQQTVRLVLQLEPSAQPKTVPVIGQMPAPLKKDSKR